MARTTIAYVPTSHLDLFWLGNYKTCLDRGAALIKTYLDRCLGTEEETFFLESVVFAEDFLRRNPNYLEPMRQLIDEGRLEIGSVYVDRWEHLILSESHVRNLQFGKRWYERTFGRENRLATHPDLPSLAAQTTQIYAKAGIDYYVTSRKVFPDGAVWRHRAPDGSTLLVLNWPRHYIYIPLDPPSDMERGHASFAQHINLERTIDAFPAGTVPMPGGAGDLADPETFMQVYGATLQQLVAGERERHPELEFGYTVPSRVLDAYVDRDVPELAGEIPSVWGVAADEEVTFFQRDRAIERLLLTGETAVAMAEHLGIAWRPAGSDAWKGVYDEETFFGRKDPIPAGEELPNLWRMHVFTQDHNGGGKEGALSTFQKRVIQERCLNYGEQIVDAVLDGLGSRIDATGDHVIVLNPQGRSWRGVLEISLPTDRWDAGDRVQSQGGVALPCQMVERAEGAVRCAVLFPEIPPVGYAAFPLGSGAETGSQAGTRPGVRRTADSLHVFDDEIEVSLSLTTGNLLSFVDRATGMEWGGQNVGRVSAMRESGNDVTLRMAPGEARTEQEFGSVELVASGQLFTQLRVEKRLLGADVVQFWRLWHGERRLDLEITIRWWGAHNWQIRLGLPTIASRADISYGSPFFGSGWDDGIQTAAPRNSDEVLLEDFERYREIQDWLHLWSETGGLGIVTEHPGFHFGDAGLEAVLMRTSPSCGDPRLFWENAGEQVYRMTFLPGTGAWSAMGLPNRATELLRSPRTRISQLLAGGNLPSTNSYFSIDGAGVILSSLYPAHGQRGIVARLYESVGASTTAVLSGELAGSVRAVDMMESNPLEVAKENGGWRCELVPWQIQTVLLDDR